MIKWHIYTRGTIHLHRFANVLKAIADGLDKKIYLSPVKSLLYINVGDKLWFAWDEKELQAYAKEVLKRAKNPKLFKKQVRQVELYANKLIAFSEKVRQQNLKKLSTAQLINHYQNLY